MKYIIMCGGVYTKWETPRQLTKINGETLVARTIRLLKECGETDISISTDNEIFGQFGVPLLKMNNHYVDRGHNDFDGYWCDCFYPTDEPTCYIFGDVVFSPYAMRTITNYHTADIMLFGSKPPFSKHYPKPWIEPFAFKVSNTEHLREACERVKLLDRQRVFRRRPIAWELWSVIKGTDPNTINKSYEEINDYTCDIDNPEDIHWYDKYYNTI